MEPQREEVRNNLVAALEAAPELPREDREHLADVFLDQLDAQFELVPRTGQRARGPQMNYQAFGPALRHWWPALALGVALFVVLPSVFWIAGAVLGLGAAHAAHHHGFFPPFFFLPFLFFFFGRFFRRWARGGYFR